MDNLAIQRHLRRPDASPASVRSIPHRARTLMEARFGADFGSVRLHTGGAPEEMNRALRARAVTHGSDIYLGEGRNTFESPGERRLLAHELTHVIQQSGRTPLSSARASGSRDMHAPAREADRISRTPLSLQRYSWDDFKKDASDVAASVAHAAERVIPAVTGGAASAAEALDWSTNWRHIQVDWNSAPAMVLKTWASQLDAATVRKIRAGGPAGALDAVSIPDYVREAAAELGRNARMDFRPTPLVDPGVKPRLPPGPGLRPAGPLIVAIIVFLLILLWPNVTPEETETRYLEEEAKRKADEKKKEPRDPRGKCRETIPALRSAIHATTLGLLTSNAQNFLRGRFEFEPRTREELGDILFRSEFPFFLAIKTQTKNTILKVCSVPNDTLATSSGNKLIGTSFHAEEIAAPPLSAQLAAVPAPERAGATLFNVCQSRACVKPVTTNPEGCTAVLEQIKDTQLPGGEVVDEPTGFPPDAALRPAADAALERALRSWPTK